MNKKIKKIVTLSLLCVGVFSTAALAYTTGQFTYGDFTANGTLKTSWSVFGNDTGSARTERVGSENTRYNVTSYLEAEDGGTIVGTNFDLGYQWAQSDVTASGVNRFNSTHAIAFSSNAYASKTYRTLSDS